jgi:type II secretory pathway component PulC
MQSELHENHALTVITPSTTIVKEDHVPQHATGLITKIPEQHLFGTAVKINTSDLPITSLQLQLIGVIAAKPDNLSRIIISSAGGSGKVYKIGDALGAIRVNAITPSGVILENNGRLEKLPLQREMLSFQVTPKKLLNTEE